MLTPLILFLGLTVATAVIAHWSDNLGKKLGKKRVSLFGLRPRTTATVLTVASSWAIMLFTLVVLLAAVVPLRNALFSYDRKTEEYRSDIAKADAQIAATRARLASTQGQFDAATAQLDSAKSDLDKANSAVKKAQDAAKEAEDLGKKRTQAANEAADRAVKAAKAAQNQVVAAQNRVFLAQNRLASAQNRLATARDREKAALGNERAAQRETKVATRETLTAQRQTKAAQRLRQNAERDLQNSLKSLKIAKSELNSTQASLKSAGASYLRARDKAFEVTSQVLKLESQRNALQDLAAQTAPFVESEAPIKVGRTFAAGIIAANQGPQMVAEQLRVLVRQGQEAFAAEEDNASKFPEGAALQLLPLTDQDASGKSVLLEDDAIVRRFAFDLAQRREPTSVRLVAPRNYLSGETRIEAVLRVVPIKPAFAAGETLASTTIDGASGDALIFNSLLELTNLGRSEAERRGVNPPQLGDEPLFYAKDTNVAIFKVLRQIESSRARVRVNLVAAKALSTVEPLRIRLEIEDGAPGAATS